MDIALASVALVVAVPVSLLVAIAIFIDGPGPILYSQNRVGLDRRRRRSSPIRGEQRTTRGYGRPFRIFKFRSMVLDAERHTGPVWATDQDPRTTRVGAILRSTHLDEIPQLLNVLRGDMSLVGPRPERPEMFARLVGEIPGYALRCRARPGVTGLAQLRNGYDTSLQSVARKVKFDLYYIRHASLLLDLRIMVDTGFLLLRRAAEALSSRPALRRQVSEATSRPDSRAGASRAAGPILGELQSTAVVSRDRRGASDRPRGVPVDPVSIGHARRHRGHVDSSPEAVVG